MRRGSTREVYTSLQVEKSVREMNSRIKFSTTKVRVIKYKGGNEKL